MKAPRSGMGTGIPCTNSDEGCKGLMENRGNYYFCLHCGAMEFKLPDHNGVWVPLKRQGQFLESTHKNALYVGGVGSGKTMVGCFKAILKTQEHPDGMGLIGAQIFPQLRDATMHTFWQVCPEILMWKKSKEKAFNKSDGILTMDNGFQILFRPLDDEGKLRSLNLVFFWIDEASEVSKDIFLMLQSRLRSMQGYRWYEDEDNNEAAHQGWVTSNPNGRDWLHEIFVAESDPDYYWINAPTKENKYLPKGFEAGLRKKWPESWVRRFLDGSFDAFEGQIYPMIEENTHQARHYEYLEDGIHMIPAGWPVFVSLDHGYTNPTAVGFFTIDPFGRHILFDEIYETQKPVSWHAAEIRRKLESWKVPFDYVQDWLIDPSTRGQRGTEGKDVMQEYHDQKIPFRPANNKVQAGILQVVEYLMPEPLSSPEPDLPHFIIHPRCVNSWREMGGYRWKPQTSTAKENEPEAPLKKNDHCPDMIRYHFMEQPKLSLMTGTSYYHQMLLQKSQYSLNEKNLPYALQSNSNWNSSAASSIIRW